MSLISTNSPLFSIILPTYNRPQYLPPAINSVLSQTYNNWELILADNASDQSTQTLLKQYQQAQVILKLNPENIGLYPNLNQAIRSSSGQYILLLCSDDFLLPNCLQTLVERIEIESEIGLFLTAFDMVNGDGISIPSGSLTHYQNFMQPPTQTLSPGQSIPILLKWGSINGNLTGMCFKRALFDQIGGFREDWRHAADWEWVYRACTKTSISLSTAPIAVIREHSEQLSGLNYTNISNSIEVIEMVRILLQDPNLKNLAQAKRWALHILQFHLWFALKFALKGKWKEAKQIIFAINQITGIGATTIQMLKWLPIRWQVNRKEIPFPMPPD
jgi:glycosyltransferase involved in cell wall biosynthesis